MKQKLLSASVSASALLTLPLAAHAQTSSPPASQAEAASAVPATRASRASAEKPVATLKSVTITAERRKQSAQDVGASVSVLSGRDLKDMNVNNVNDLQHATASVEVEPAFGGGQPQFRIRGVGFIDYSANNSSTVGVNVDDVAYALPIQTQGQIFDIDRVEVLRGPQGTLYGRNTTGGTINFITNKPTNEFEAGITTEYGSHNLFNNEGYISGPISDTLRGRLAFSTSDFGAWQTNRATGQSLGNNDTAAVRGQLDWDATRDLKFHLEAHTGFDKSDNEGLSLIQPFTSLSGGAGQVLVPADTNYTATGWGLSPAFAHLVGISPDAKPGRDNDSNGISLTATYSLGLVQLTSITAYNFLHRREYADWDATSYSASDEYFNDTVNEFTQEFRVSSNNPQSRLHWVAGTFYSHDSLDEKFYSDFTDRLGIMALTAYDQQVNTLGVYGQATYDITSRLHGIFGLRQEHETRDLTNFESGSVTDSSFSPFYSPSAPNQSVTSNGTSGKIGIEYNLLPKTLLYATISRGYKSGGFTAHNTTDSDALAPFKPETLTAYEAGFKSDLNRSLRLNTSAFHYDYRDQQVLSAVYDSNSQSLIGTFVNAPKSEINGFESELEWDPIAGLTISQYVGYKEGKYTAPFVTYDTQASAAAGHNVFTNYQGTALSFPRLSYGGQVSYNWRTDGYRFRAETNYSFHDTYSQLLLLGPGYTVESYWLVNASVSVTPPGGHWDFTFWARNLFNRQYDLTKNFFLPGDSVAAVGEPRTIGVRISYKF